jgi:ubiquinone/menaquinone biosynthesis C-methylase UbiE
MIFRILLFTILSLGMESLYSQGKIHYSCREKKIFRGEISKFNLSDGDTLVDIGAGFGINDALIFKFYPKMYFILLDIDSSYLEENRFSFRSEGKKYHFKDRSKKMLSYSDSIPLASSTYRNILCRISLHEFTNPNKTLQEIKRIMTKDGKLIIVERIPKYEGQKDSYCDKRLFKKEEILALLSSNGFILTSESITHKANGNQAYVLLFQKKNK